MSLATHRAALAAALGAVPNVGLVHDEEPYARAEAAFRALYMWANPDTGRDQLRGWFIRRVRTAERELGVGRTLNVHSWQVRGFMALEPPDSGKTFDDLVEAMRQVLRTNPTLSGAVQPGPLEQATGVQVQESTPVMFVGVLCHGATLTLNTFEYLSTGE